jgi:hypothetical protein
MARSPEVRSQLLDRKAVEFAVSMSFLYKLDVRRGKKLLKAAFERWLGKEWKRRPKHGFSIPLADWLRDPLQKRRDEALLGDLARELFDSRILEKWSREHDSGSVPREELASGRPVCASAIGGIPDILGRCGYRVALEVGPIKWARTLRTLCRAYAEDVGKLPAPVWERAERFSWEQSLDHTRAFYEEALR